MNLDQRILEGEFDSHIDFIARAALMRRSFLKEQQQEVHAPIAVGDIIEFVSTIRPKYLAGIRAEVLKVNRKTVTCAIGSDGGRFSNTETRCPKSLVRRVSTIPENMPTYATRTRTRRSDAGGNSTRKRALDL